MHFGSRALPNHRKFHIQTNHTHTHICTCVCTSSAAISKQTVQHVRRTDHIRIFIFTEHLNFHNQFNGTRCRFHSCSILCRPPLSQSIDQFAATRRSVNTVNLIGSAWHRTTEQQRAPTPRRVHSRTRSPTSIRPPPAPYWPSLPVRMHVRSLFNTHKQLNIFVC